MIRTPIVHRNSLHGARVAKLFLFTLGLICTGVSSSAVEPTTQSRSTSHSATSSMGQSARTFESSRLLPRSISFNGGLNYQYTKTDGSLPGISSTNGEVQELELSLNFSQNDLWQFSYRPTYTIYSEVELEDGYSHSFAFNLGKAANFGISGWSINFKPDFDQSSRLLIETGTQTDETVWGATLSASRDLSKKLYLDLAYDYDNRKADQVGQVSQLSSSNKNSVSTALRYQSNLRFSSSLILNYGITKQDGGDEITNLGALLNVQLNPTEKLKLGGGTGINGRKTNIPGSQKTTNPTYDIFINYQPFPQTQVKLQASKSDRTSYISNRIVENESITTSLEQRILEHFQLTLSYGQNNDDYIDYRNSNALARSDAYDSYTISLGTTFRKRIPVSIFYRLNENTSTDSTNFGFSSDQTGINIGYQF